MVQERLDGRLYYDLYRDGEIGDEVFEHIREIVRLAHAAELFDVDLHAGNFLVVRDDSGERIPKMFDFNFIPFYLHPPNPAVWLGVQLGILDRAWRDRRKLKAFHDFTRMDRKRELFGKEGSDDRS